MDKINIVKLNRTNVNMIYVNGYGSFRVVEFEPFIGCTETLYVVYSRKTFERTLCDTLQGVADALELDTEELIANLPEDWYK